MGEWIGDARCRYTEDLISITREPSPSIPTGCTSAKGKHGLGARAIATPPSWVSALSLRQREEFYWRVSVYQETAVTATYFLHKNGSKWHTAVPDLEVQSLSLRPEVHTRPGPYKGVTRGPTRITSLASLPRTYQIAPRVWIPSMPHSKHAFWFLFVNVCRTPRWGWLLVLSKINPLGCTKDTHKFYESFPFIRAWRKLRDQNNKEEGLKGGRPLPISRDISLVCMECSLDKKFVSVEGCFWEPQTVSGFIVIGWYLLSCMGLRWDYCISYQTSLLLVSLGEGSEGWSLNGNIYPDIICTWGSWEDSTTLISRCRWGMTWVIRRGTVPPFLKNITRSSR